MSNDALEATAFGDTHRAYVSAKEAAQLQKDLEAKLAEKAENIIEELVGQELDFYGCDGNRFRLDDVTYEYIERSGGYDIVVSAKPLDGLPIARVIVEHAVLDPEDYMLFDLHDEHLWLEFGVRTFISEREPYFDYTPKDAKADD